MNVKDIIISVLKIIGRADIAAAVKGGETLSAQDSETVETLLYCFNATEDEIARNYVPLKSCEVFTSTNDKFLLFIFKHTPVRILRVRSEGKEIPFGVFPEYVYAQAFEVYIDYEYLPSKKQLADKSSYSDEVGENVLVYGTVAEYCLINGEIEAADVWESKYRSAVDAAQNRLAEGKDTEDKKLAAGGYIPPRRWV